MLLLVYLSVVHVVYMGVVCAYMHMYVCMCVCLYVLHKCVSICVCMCVQCVCTPMCTLIKNNVFVYSKWLQLTYIRALALLASLSFIL